MKKTFYSLIALTIIFTVFSCGKAAIGEIYKDDNVNFSNYKSFNFAEMSIDNQTKLEPRQTSIESLYTAIRNEMKRRGYAETSGGDLVINLGIVMDIGETVRETTIREAPTYIGQRNYYWESEEIVVSTYDRGTAIVDIVDSKDNKLIWQGSATRMIVDDMDKMQERISNGIRDLFKKFPVKPM